MLGRRADGWHELDSFVAFAGVGDRLLLTPDERLGLTLAGPTAAGLATDESNLVLQAALSLAKRVKSLKLGRFHLEKALPVAAGLGGGSSDAAAALRALAALNGLRIDDPRVVEAAAETGADVPVCLSPRARMMRGRGERLGEPVVLPRLAVVMANPGTPVKTRRVFETLGLAPGQEGFAPTPPVDASSLSSLVFGLAAARNDLETPAAALAPAIDEALAWLRAAPGARLARMSGSGATCFAIFSTRDEAVAEARRLRLARPNWWVKATVLR